MYSFTQKNTQNKEKVPYFPSRHSSAANPADVHNKPGTIATLLAWCTLVITSNLVGLVSCWRPSLTMHNFYSRTQTQYQANVINSIHSAVHTAHGIACAWGVRTTV